MIGSHHIADLLNDQFPISDERLGQSDKGL